MKNEKVQKSIPEIEAEAMEKQTSTQPHYHKDERGVLVQCYHACTKGLGSVRETLTNPVFWIGTTVTWPFEHFLYEHVPPFSWIAHLMGH